MKQLRQKLRKLKKLSKKNNRTVKKSFLDLRLSTRRENSLLKQPDKFKFKSKRTMSSTPLKKTSKAFS